MTVCAYEHLVYLVTCSSVSWIREKYYNYNNILMINILKKYKDKPFPFIPNFKGLFKHRMKLQLGKNKRRQQMQEPEMIYNMFSSFLFCWGEVATTKWRKCALPTKFTAFFNCILSRSGSAYQEIIHIVTCSLRGQLCCRACLPEAHSVKQNLLWALQLILRVYTKKAFLRGSFLTFKEGNFCTSNGCT